MSHKKKIIHLSIISSLPTLLLLIIASSCSPKHNCLISWLNPLYNSQSLESMLELLFPISIAFFPSLFILFFCKKEVYDTWKKLALGYLVLWGYFILRQLSIQDTGGGVILGGGGYVGGLEYILAGFFVIISLLIIIT